MPTVSSIIFGDQLNSYEGISNYFETSPYYFDEYTLHGTRHVSVVLEYADRLIPDSTYSELSDYDISILVLGILLHDLGMFIKESGLKYLLQQTESCVYDEGTDTYFTWMELWDNHIYKLKHASGKDLNNIFGNAEHIFDITSRQVCASFIRKYHHQIAHYMAIHGFPGNVTHSILNGVGFEYAKLIGLLAKSHGTSLRSLSKEIDDFGYDNNLPLNVPIYYLMSILRLADLLDADGKRAPKILSDMNDFLSLRSKNEWTLNQLISGRQWAEQTGKPETLKIIASPNNSVQFIELKSWFDYWQRELDLCWAIIGETHGDKYKLSIRRITSNIYHSDYNFVTNPVTINVNPDIVKLLVAPLYGDDPSFGVRELLQNAIDACNERTAIDGTVGRITVNVNEKDKTFTITDNGIGMNEDVLKNYYLCAGASYRYSQQWADAYLDDEKQPKFARSGRFGVGALATFLIGNKATVVTRHIKDTKGYCFEYTIEPGILNIERIEESQPGTTIEIAMNEKALREFTNHFWNPWTEWYHFKKPNICFVVNGKELKQEKLYDLEKDKDSEGWFSCECADYDSLHWSLTEHIEYGHGGFMCNGIHIPDYYSSDSRLKRSLTDRGYYGRTPNISIIDKAGIFPVDLARKTVLDTFVLNDDVVAELCKYKIASLLVHGQQNDKDYIFNKRGFIPKERSFVLNIARPVYLIGKGDSTYEVATDFGKYDIVIGFFEANKKTYAKNLGDQIIGEKLKNSSIITEIWANSLAVSLPKTVGYMPPPKMIHIIDQTKNWQDSLPLPLSIIGDNNNLIVKYEPSSIREGENNIMYNTIQELLPNNINGGWIPFITQEREKMYHDTYKKLKRYIDAIKSQNFSQDDATIIDGD